MTAFLRRRDGLAGLALFVAVALAAVAAATHHQRDLFAYVCDTFGYARQAQLFRDEGLAGGLDTRIRNPEAAEMISAARAVAPQPQAWYQAVAPHCHHYKTAVDAVVLQYPPGTGLVLSLFPEPTSLSWMVIVAATVIAGVFVFAAAGREWHPAGLAAGMGALVLIELSLEHSDAVDTQSIAVTMALIPAAVGLFFGAFSGPRARDGLALALGALGGLLFAVRLPNAFLLAGLAAQVTLTRKLWLMQRLREDAVPLALGLGGFVLTGPALVMAANRINAGSVFSSTYSAIDSTAPAFQWSLAAQTLKYYFTTPLAWPLLVAAFAGLLAATLYARRRTVAGEGRTGFLTAAWVALLLSMGFFLTHSIRVSYYLVPACEMALCLAVLGIGHSFRPRAHAGWLAALALLPLAGFAGWKLANIHPAHIAPRLPEEVLRPQAIVWADLSSGTTLYYQHKYSAKLLFADNCLQEKWVHELWRRGRPQYFVIDSPAMKSLAERFRSLVELSPAGVFELPAKNAPVLKLDPSSAWREPPCRP